MSVQESCRHGRRMFLQDLRDQGHGIIDCIKVVRHITDCSLRDAKILVTESQAWSDQRAQNEEFHEQL
jgi:ribosomal protein L7/L12